MPTVVRSWLKDLNQFGRAFFYVFGVFAVVYGILHLARPGSTLGLVFAIVTLGSGVAIVVGARRGRYDGDSDAPPLRPTQRR